MQTLVNKYLRIYDLYKRSGRLENVNRLDRPRFLIEFDNMTGQKHRPSYVNCAECWRDVFLTVMDKYLNAPPDPSKRKKKDTVTEGEVCNGTEVTEDNLSDEE